MIAVQVQKTKNVEEEIDEIEIERKGGDDGEPCVIDSHIVDLFDLLRVVCCEADKNEYTEDAEDEIQPRWFEEDVDDARDDDA